MSKCATIGETPNAADSSFARTGSVCRTIHFRVCFCRAGAVLMLGSLLVACQNRELWSDRVRTRSGSDGIKVIIREDLDPVAMLPVLTRTHHNALNLPV